MFWINNKKNRFTPETPFSPFKSGAKGVTYCMDMFSCAESKTCSLHFSRFFTLTRFLSVFELFVDIFKRVRVIGSRTLYTLVNMV